MTFRDDHEAALARAEAAEAEAKRSREEAERATAKLAMAERERDRLRSEVDRLREAPTRPDAQPWPDDPARSARPSLATRADAHAQYDDLPPPPSNEAPSGFFMLVLAAGAIATVIAIGVSQSC